MKKFVVVMLALPALVLSQTIVTVYPYPNPMIIDSLAFFSGKDTIKARGLAQTFSGMDSTALTGRPVSSPFLPMGTEVVKKLNDTTIILSKKATTDTAKTTATVGAFGYYSGSQVAYATGDLVGIPFFFQAPHYPGMYLDEVLVMDSAAQVQNVDVILYDAAVITYSADNAAYAPGGASFDNVVAYGTVATWKGIGTNTSIGYVTDLRQAVPAPIGGWYYGVVVSRGTGNFLGNRSLVVKLIFR